MLEDPTCTRSWNTEPDNAIASMTCVSLDLLILQTMGVETGLQYYKSASPQQPAI